MKARRRTTDAGVVAGRAGRPARRLVRGTRALPAHVRKLAVLRANSLGDFVFALPALEALKRRFPAAELVYLGREWHRDYLAGRPGPVDRVVAVPRCDGIPHERDRAGDPQAVEGFFAAMRREAFDIAFQMHGGGAHANPFTRALGAKLTVGLQAPDAPALDVNVHYTLYQPEVVRFLEVVDRVGAQPARIAPVLTATPADAERLRAAVPTLRQPYAVLHPGASDPRRRWPAERFAVVGDLLAQAGLHVYVTGMPPEARLVDRVTAAMRFRADELCGLLPLSALTALLAGAEVLVANDTGPLHLARAVGTPSVGVYWIGNYITAGVAALDGHRAGVSWQTHCPRCGMDCVDGDAHRPARGCTHEVSFVDSIDVAQVAAHAQSLLAAGEGGGRGRLQALLA